MTGETYNVPENHIQRQARCMRVLSKRTSVSTMFAMVIAIDS